MSPPLVVDPPTTARRPPRTTRDAAAGAFRRRVELFDRAARSLISISGIGIIAAVLGIGVFLVSETAPLFRAARVRPALSSRPVVADTPRLVLLDEHQLRAIVLGSEPIAHVVSLNDGAPVETIPVPELGGQHVTAVARVLREPVVALGTDQGRVWIGSLGLRTVFDGSTRAIRAFVEPNAVIDAVPGFAIERVAFRVSDDESVLACLVKGSQDLIITWLHTTQPLIGPARTSLESAHVSMASIGQPTGVLLDTRGKQLLVGTVDGFVARWQLSPDSPSSLIETTQVTTGPVAAMTWLLGDRSMVIGGTDGSVATWSLVRDDANPDGWRLAQIHVFAPHPAAIVEVTASPRDKGFVTWSADGTGRLQYMTSERLLASWSVSAPPVVTDMAPKTNGLAAVDVQGSLRHWLIDNPHPDFSWRALFGKIWYEGYPGPAYVWQSSGGTDDFEPKYSLVPLAFGTFKGTCYALLFAVPLALGGALYCSQFLEKSLRNTLKSTIELMAALPSVVLGFVAGLVLAPLVQGHIVAVLAAPVVIPLVCVAGMSACTMWPSTRGTVRRHEFAMLTLWIAVGVLATAWLGPAIERVAFGGDFQAWLLETTGIRYDQRNALIVGWVMGFAVIPLIFTICEDAFSAVPKHLTGASLACGASLWQTAWRVVFPAAGSGVFSAVMVGFGRAIGETMIVLMATGNTPVMDWNIFNGFRALSANIAVEIPEAAHGATLYRVLFVAALLLFGMTFLVNTLAEVVRLRLRKQLQGL